MHAQTSLKWPPYPHPSYSLSLTLDHTYSEKTEWELAVNPQPCHRGSVVERPSDCMDFWHEDYKVGSYLHCIYIGQESHQSLLNKQFPLQLPLQLEGLEEAACPQSMQEVEILCLCDLGFEHLYVAFFNLSHVALEDGFGRFSHDIKLDYLSKWSPNLDGNLSSHFCLMILQTKTISINTHFITGNHLKKKKARCLS